MPFRHYLRAIAALLFAAFVAACTQSHAGLTEAEVKWCPDEAGKTRLCGAKIIDGKEKKSVTLAVKLADGSTVYYAAADVLAFQAFAIRAEVEKSLTETVGKTIPEIATAVTRAVIGAGAIGAISDAGPASAALDAARIKADLAGAAAARGAVP